MGTQVEVERNGRVILATLSNPPHALMTQEMMAELDALALEAEADDGIGAVVLTGAHPERFLAHFDVQALLEGAEGVPSLSPRQARAIGDVVRGLRRVPAAGSALGKGPGAGMVELEEFHATLSRIGQSGAVWIAAINGAAMGGGCELSLACDLRLISAGGMLGQPEILFGFPPGGGGTQRLGRLIGRARALEMILEGRPVEAEEALATGMVHRVVEPDELVAVALETAERLARRPKAAVAAAKRAVLEGGSLPLAAGLRLEKAEFMATVGSDASRRTMAAYVEHTERTGELPIYDEDARERLLDGTFVDMNA